MPKKHLQTFFFFHIPHPLRSPGIAANYEGIESLFFIDLLINDSLRDLFEQNRIILREMAADLIWPLLKIA